MATYTNVVKQLAANGLLLASVCEEPGDDAICHVPPAEGDYRLPVEVESYLAEDFAFLAARTDDPSRVMGAALEEHPDKKGVTLRLASNTGDVAKSKTIKGLREIASVLKTEGTSTQSKKELTSSLFARIVQFDQRKIVSRLRFRHAIEKRNRSRLRLTRQLQRIIPRLSKASSHVTNDHIGFAREFEVKLTQLSRDFEKLPKPLAYSSTGQEILRRLIYETYLFTKNVNLAIIFNNFDNRQHRSIKNFWIRVTNVARYYVISKRLVIIQRKRNFRILQHVTIEGLEKPEINDEALQHLPTFEASIGRYSCALIPGERAEAREVYDGHLRANSAKWKAHAEVQLVLFYDRNHIALPPRVIGSSKKACYLCHLFVTRHGRFSVPSTHGKLYPAWIMPAITKEEEARYMPVLQHCSAELHRQITQALSHPTRSTNQHTAESTTCLPQSPSESSKSTITGSLAGLSDLDQHASGSDDSTETLQGTALVADISYPPMVELIQGLPLKISLRSTDPSIRARTPAMDLILSSSTPEPCCASVRLLEPGTPQSKSVHFDLATICDGSQRTIALSDIHIEGGQQILLVRCAQSIIEVCFMQDRP